MAERDVEAKIAEVRKQAEPSLDVLPTVVVEYPDGTVSLTVTFPKVTVDAAREISQLLQAHNDVHRPGIALFKQENLSQYFTDELVEMLSGRRKWNADRAVRMTIKNLKGLDGDTPKRNQ